MNPLDVLETKQSLAGMAELLAHYYHELRNNGLTRVEALRIVVGYQAEIIRTAGPPQ